MSSTHRISQKMKRTSPVRTPTPYQLRALVLDYLSHQCYTKTAEAFIRDSTVLELDADGDEISNGREGRPGSSEDSESFLRNIEHRAEIRNLILAGRVDEAIDRLNAYFPSVLAETPSESAGPESKKTDAIGAKSLKARYVDYDYPSATSVEPSHLFLNLRILAFTEACRTRPLEIPSSIQGVSSSSSDTPDGPAGIPSSHPNSSSSPSANIAKMSTDKQALLITRAQKLYAVVKTLPKASDREIYSKEIENVAGLLAYEVPETCPVSKYLSYERREAVADQISRAILYRCGSSPVPAIELMARFTTVLWSEARAHGAKARPGALLPPTDSRRVGSKTEVKAEADAPEELPLFNLTTFLDAKP